MAETIGGWIAETPWMPKLHTPKDDLGFCQRLVTRTEVWVVDTQAGFGFLARAGDEIDALYLAPDVRGCGWGTALLSAVKPDRARLTLWTFQANTRAIGFYEANGFHISNLTTGEGNAEKLPDAHMIWERPVP